MSFSILASRRVKLLFLIKFFNGIFFNLYSTIFFNNSLLVWFTPLVDYDMTFFPILFFGPALSAYTARLTMRSKLSLSLSV